MYQNLRNCFKEWMGWWGNGRCWH